MASYFFSLPDVYFGENAIQTLRRLNHKKVAIVTDSFMVSSGKTRDLINEMPQACVSIFSEVKPDPSVEILHAGADKISVNSPALGRPDLIDELAAAFGVQCVVVGIDSQRDADGEWRVRRFSGDPSSMQALPRRTLDWVAEAQQRGAGEIVLNCIDADGVRRGYDIEQLRAVRDVCTVPLVK